MFGDPDAPIPRRPASTVEVPLSAFQRRMWYLCTSYPGTSSTLVCVVRRLHGPLDVAALEKATGTLVDRHEGLRAVFPNRPDGPVQVIGPPRGLPVEHVDLTGLPEARREERARELLAEGRKVLMDLERGPLVTACLLRLGDQDHIWSLTLHHLLGDGATGSILQREFSALYTAYVEGTDPDLPDPPIGYGDYALWQATTGEPLLREGVAYWREQLAGVPPLTLPTDFPRPPAKGTRADAVRHLVDAELDRRVEELARSQRCTRFMAMVAALQALLGHEAGQDDVCVGTPVVGRTRAELESLVGLLANMVALRGDLSGDPTFLELLARTRDTVIDALDHQDVPFGQVVSALAAPHDPARTQVFSVIFVLDEFEAVEGMRLPGIRAEEFPVQPPQVIHDLVLDAWRREDGLTTVFRYDSALFAEATVARLARRYEGLLRAAVERPDARLSELVRQSW
jgi:hypothetical protein